MTIEAEARTKAIGLVIILIVIGITLLLAFQRDSANGFVSINPLILINGIFLVALVHIAQSLHILTIKRSERNRMCVKCGREIPFESVICPYCRHDYEPLQDEQDNP
jgi:hypothetical protein